MKFTKRDQGAAAGSDKYLKLKDGESINGIFRGEIFEHFVKWEAGKSIDVGPDDPGAKIRFKLNFVTMIDGAFKAKIWDFPQAVYNQLGDLHEEYPLETTKLKISRRGTGTDTVYSILPLLKEPIPPSIMKQIEAVPLNMLDTKPQVKKWDAGLDDVPMPESDDDVLPF